VRFIDRDLNRCFALGDDAQNGYETKRAMELLNVVKKEKHTGGALGKSEFQMLVDMHSSASNMGICLMVCVDPIFLCAKYMC